MSTVIREEWGCAVFGAKGEKLVEVKGGTFWPSHGGTLVVAHPEAEYCGLITTMCLASGTWTTAKVIYKDER